MMRPPGSGWGENRRLRLFESVVVLAVAAAALLPGLSSLSFHPDESHWIGLSAPFEAFVAGRFTDPIWQDRQDKATNATVTYYVIGAARRLGGYPPERLNRPWRWFASYEANQAEGRIPEPGLLWWSRAGVTTASVIALWICFILLRDAAGRPAAYAWLAVALVNPYLRETLRHAMNEGVLLSFIASATYATSRALSHLDRRAGAPGAGIRAAAWLAAGAVAAGLAAQTKLNGALAAVGMIIVVAFAATRHGQGWVARMRRAGFAALLVGGVSFAVFIAANPSLWSDPLREPVRAVRARAEVTRAQLELSDGRGLGGRPDRISVVASRVFVDCALVPLRIAGPILFAIGAGGAIAGLFGWMRRRSHNHALASLVTLGAAVSLPMLLTPLDRPRFYVLPAVFFGMAAAAGLAWTARALLHSIAKTRWRTT
jgi:hypothetical protein